MCCVWRLGVQIELYCVHSPTYPSQTAAEAEVKKKDQRRTYLSCTRNRKFNLEADSCSAAWKKWKLDLSERGAIFRGYWSVLCFSRFVFFCSYTYRTQDTRHAHVSCNRVSCIVTSYSYYIRGVHTCSYTLVGNSNNPTSMLEHCETENTPFYLFPSTRFVIFQSP